MHNFYTVHNDGNAQITGY